MFIGTRGNKCADKDIRRMPLYALKSGLKIERIKKSAFKTEKEMQKLVESNLPMLFNLEFVRSEFALGNLRIDTLVFDPENKCFVIIEYKNDRNFSVIDQGYAYLALLLNNKADFILEYNERMKMGLRKDELDWSQSRVIFISPEFTKYQKGAINFRDLPIELWEISVYENGMVLMDSITTPEGSESIEKISPRGESFKEVAREIKVYSEQDHLNGLPEEISELYENLKMRIISLGGVMIVPKKHYIGFKTEKNFVDIHPQKSQIKIWLNMKKGELDDPKALTRNMKGIGHWGNGEYELILTPDADLDYVMTLIKQSFKKQIQ